MVGPLLVINMKVFLIKQNECNSQLGHAAEAESRATGGGRGQAEADGRRTQESVGGGAAAEGKE